MTTPTRTRPRVDRRPSRRLPSAAVVLAAVALQLIALPGTSAAAATPSLSPRPRADTPAGAPKSPNPATFGIGPARHGKPDPNRPYFSYLVTPGVRVTDSVIVNNYSTSALTLAVYVTDAFNAANGDFALQGQGVRPTGAGAWISVDTPHRSGVVTIPARSRAVLPVRVRIPATATPGDHAAGVIASLSTISKNSKGANVRLLQRIGTRVFIRVSGPLHPKLSIEQLSAHYRTNWNPIGRGSAVVSYRVRNTGNVILGARQQVSVHGMLGPTALISPPSVPPLLPGNQIDVRVVVGHVVPEISTTASVRLTPLVLPGDTVPGLHTWSASTHFWAVPWIVLAVLALIVAGGFWWWWRRRRHERAGSTPATPPTAGQHHTQHAARDRRGATVLQRRRRAKTAHDNPPSESR